MRVLAIGVILYASLDVCVCVCVCVCAFDFGSWLYAMHACDLPLVPCAHVTFHSCSINSNFYSGGVGHGRQRAVLSAHVTSFKPIKF